MPGFTTWYVPENCSPSGMTADIFPLSPKSPEPHLFLAVVLGDHLENDKAAQDELELYKSLGGAEPAALRWLDQLKNPKGK